MRALLVLGIGTAAMLAGDAQAKVLADSFIAGRDANGEPCSAARSWNDPRAAGLFDTAYAITCRGVAASRRQGVAYAFRKAPAPADEKLCGAAAVQTMKGIGPVETRACFDPAIGTPVITIAFKRGSQYYGGAAVATALGPLETALRAIVGRGAGREALPTSRDAQITASIAAAGLAPAPVAAAETARNEQLDAAAALQAGIALNYRGLYIEASRLLNDALSRLPASVPGLTRAELALEAGLSDSNISQFDAADEHFERAGLLLKGTTNLDRASFLESKRATYLGLDRINRRDWPGAIAALSENRKVVQPLTDPAVLSDLNQPAKRGAAASVSSIDSAQLSRLLVEAQRNWARSVAYLAIGDTTRSRAALDEGKPYVAELQRNVRPDAVAALKSRLERQYGRVAARDGRIPQAVEHFDCAIAILQGGRPPSGKPCLLDVPGGAAQTDSVAGGGPLIAEAQLERASLLARETGTTNAVLLRDFDAAVDSLIRSGAGGGIVQPAMETYLDLLSRLHAAAPGTDLEERFFRAIQSVGEPAIARQVAQLQNIVTANGPLGAKARDRAEAERQIIRLRYEISAVAPGDSARRTALEAERQTAEANLLTANVALASDPRFRAVDDQPATVADIRAALRPQEYFVKVTRLRSRAYAMVIGTGQTFIYPLGAPAADIDVISRRVRASIRNDSGRLPFFDVAAGFALFRLIAGPAEAALVAAKAIVVDPSGPLENLPAGVLVTDLASVKRYAQTRSAAPNDYSAVAFLGASADISNALSPRSFLITRKLPPSTAAKAFIGFGENAPAQLSRIPAGAKVSFGTGCDIPYAELAEVMNANRPVSAHELGIAAAALGVPGAPEITREAFTDTAIMAASARGEYTGYQVLHFATHGLPETRAGQCTRIPPSLVTTLAPPAAGGAPQSDGLLSLPEVAQLRLDANLVVLAACETASGVSGVGGRLSGQDESAATLDGLVRAFVTANARAVVATYWQIPASTETEDFVASFYGAGRTQNIGSALRTAQRLLIAQPLYSHPYFWGAYFLVGDGSKTMLTQAAPALAAVR